MMVATASAVPAQDGIELDQLHAFMHALRVGDFRFRIAVTEDMSWKAEELARGLNRHMEQMAQLAAEVSRVCDEIGTQGRLGPQAEHTFGPGSWRQLIESINLMACHLTDQLRDMHQTARLIARGDGTRPVTCDCQGETLALKTALNAIGERLRGQ